METMREYVKNEFYGHTYGEREIFSCFKSSLSTVNDNMTSIAKAVRNITKKRELTKILHLATSRHF